MDNCIENLKKIKKDQLDERSFYEQILTELTTLEGFSLIPQDASKLKSTLEEIGCVRYNVWKEAKERAGEDVGSQTIGEGIRAGDIGTAVDFVSQLLGTYSNARYALSKMLDGGEKAGWVQCWLRNSSKVRENESKTETSKSEELSKKIEGLSTIKKDELDERTFYEEVLKFIVGLDGVKFTPEVAEQVKDALEAIGCVRYDVWEAEKKAQGQSVPNCSVGQGIEEADIGTAVNFVSQLLGDYDNASFSLPYMLDGGEEYGWVQTWLRNSGQARENEVDAEISKSDEISEKLAGLSAIKKDELDERNFYEEVLKVIVGLDGVSLTPKSAKQVKDTLESIGCVRYDVWEAEKKAQGQSVPNCSVGQGIEEADIGTAVNFVSQLLGDYDNASFSLPYMLEGGEKYGWVQSWLRNSNALKDKDTHKTLSIKAESVEAMKDMGVTKTDILTRGKQLFDKFMQKLRPRDKNQGKDEI